jgi:hypothetical protein
MSIHPACKYLAAIGLLSTVAPWAVADPLPGEALKFYQMPLNNGFTPYLAGVPTAPPSTPYGSVPSTAIFPGHDELSTAYATAYATDPAQGTVPIAWQGTYMADDFADYAGTPIRHVRWWGSYMNQFNVTGPHVSKFLISFEHNVPASINPLTGALIPSHPDFTNPGNLHQIVNVIPAGPTPPGKFTEKFVPTPLPPGGVPPIESLYEYNAELNLDKWFNELKATSRIVDDVYWLKIVALVDEQRERHINWGWHDRDWSIPDFLAAKPGDTPDGAEHDEGPLPGAAPTPVWHFEDDAVTGSIAIFPGMSPIMPLVEQQGFVPQNYVPPVDGPSLIGQFSKDLAFELYTSAVPEPDCIVLAALCSLTIAPLTRRR